MATALDQGRRLQHADRGEQNHYVSDMDQLKMHGQPEDIEHAYRYLMLDGEFAPRLLHIPSEYNQRPLLREDVKAPFAAAPRPGWLE